MQEAADAYFAAAGCTMVELTSASHRTAAHRFYERHGFAEKPKGFVKPLHP